MNESKITATVVAKSLVVNENVLVRKTDVVMTEVPAKQFVFEFATKVMKKADLNRNMRLTYTDMTQMLEGSHYQDFGRWVDSQKQKGFRFDADKQGSSDMNELCDVVEEYALKGGKLEVEPHAGISGGVDAENVAPECGAPSSRLPHRFQDEEFRLMFEEAILNTSMKLSSAITLT